MISYTRQIKGDPEVIELLPLEVYGRATHRFFNEQRQTGYSKEEASKGNYDIQKDVSEVDTEKTDTDTSEYDEAMDAINDLINDLEQAEQYVQLGGQ